MTTIPVLPTTPASGGHDHADDAAFVARVARRRALDRELLRRLRRLGGALAGVLVVVVLGAIAIPNFISFGCRAMQAEAKQNLKELFAAELVAGATDKLTLDVVQPGTNHRYSYFARVGGGTFDLVAIGGGPVAGDVWHIDHRGEIEHLADSCR